MSCDGTRLGCDMAMWIVGVVFFSFLFISFHFISFFFTMFWYLLFCRTNILLAKGRPNLSKKGGLWECSATFTTLWTSYVLCNIVYIAREGDTSIKGGQFGHREADS